jgi:hypothetical protein
VNRAAGSGQLRCPKLEEETLDPETSLEEEFHLLGKPVEHLFQLEQMFHTIFYTDATGTNVPHNLLHRC